MSPAYLRAEMWIINAVKWTGVGEDGKKSDGFTLQDIFRRSEELFKRPSATRISLKERNQQGNEKLLKSSVSKHKKKFLYSVLHVKLSLLGF